jgi:major membrane immunogen (membrane-anchored lipoprotein)
VAALAATVGAATAATTLAPTATGFDISFPQCNSPFPVSPGFGIVGVNDGSPLTINNCLARELTWAEGATNTDAAFYANTGNGGPSYSVGWPKGQTSPYVCAGGNSVPCSYDYGWNAARLAFSNAVSAESADGSTSPTAAATSAPWWLDVETGNQWETIEYGRNAATEDYDLSMLKGMVASFENMDVTTLGIYSTPSQWSEIVGNAGTTFAANAVWIPGYSSVAAAQVACTTASFTGGRVALIQYPSQGYDGDYVCGLITSPGTTSVALNATTTYTDQLVTTNNVGAVTYTQATGSPSLVVSATGLVSTSGALAAGVYSATGTTVDASGNAGTFSFTLDVGVLIQSSVTTATVKVSGSAAFTQQLAVTGATGATTYSETTGSPSLAVSSSGVVSTSGALAAGTYTATGTESDTSGDTGTFKLTVTVGSLVQRQPTAAVVTTSDSSTFSEQLDVGANLGAETYVQNSGTPNVLVSSSGLVTTNGTLATGNYKVAGTVTDATGDKGTFAFTLTVKATPPPPPAAPTATHVIGHVVAGKTVTLEIVGSNFYGQPHVTSHLGTIATVTRDAGHALIVRVTSRAHSRNGVYTFTITNPDGATCTVKYNQSR